MLSASGELDLLAAAGFTCCAADALNEPAERLVLDLTGLTFLDCTGARSLAAVVRSVPANCPVIIRSESPAASRVLGLLGLDLEHLRETVGAAHRTRRRAETAGGAPVKSYYDGYVAARVGW